MTELFWLLQRLDWLAIISRYDRPDTLFYLDPPYWGGEGDYGAGVFVRGDFQRMADKLKAIDAWVKAYGSEDQRARYAAGLLPEAEVVEAE